MFVWSSLAARRKDGPGSERERERDRVSVWEPHREKSPADPGQDTLFFLPSSPTPSLPLFLSIHFWVFIFIHRVIGVEGRVSKKQGAVYVCVFACVCFRVCVWQEGIVSRLMPVDVGAGLPTIATVLFG